MYISLLHLLCVRTTYLVTLAQFSMIWPPLLTTSLSPLPPQENHPQFDIHHYGQHIVEELDTGKKDNSECRYNLHNLYCTCILSPSLLYLSQTQTHVYTCMCIYTKHERSSVMSTSSVLPPQVAMLCTCSISFPSLLVCTAELSFRELVQGKEVEDLLVHHWFSAQSLVDARMAPLSAN